MLAAGLGGDELNDVRLNGVCQFGISGEDGFGKMGEQLHALVEGAFAFEFADGEREFVNGVDFLRCGWSVFALL